MKAITVNTIKTSSTLQTKILFLFLFGKIRGGKNRIRIISIIKNTPSNLNQISEESGLDYKSVQHHVNTLLKNNLVSKIGNGYGATYFVSEQFEINKPVFNEIVGKLKIRV